MGVVAVGNVASGSDCGDAPLLTSDLDSCVASVFFFSFDPAFEFGTGSGLTTGISSGWGTGEVDGPLFLSDEPKKLNKALLGALSPKRCSRRVLGSAGCVAGCAEVCDVDGAAVCAAD